ncbi:MAG: aminotransferase class III-fold pyridoxal phosphate-dependent enzyme [Rhizobiales bacterium]|nr:aminotransferase class III-fold pyridoxal phosphate-dependent enzyme [Hyphomicrobiales bacterium]
MTAVDSNSHIIAAYRGRTAGSAELYRKAASVFPSGITHDARYLLPHPIYVARAQAGRKWDVDGNDYVDYQGGHGALLLGHLHPEVMAAVAEQLSRGTHYGAASELELRWGQLIQELIPSAERVRFTSSGTEATMMALRLARAFTGRGKLVRFRGHFHGWNDNMAFGYSDHFDGTPSAGVLPAVAENVLLANPGDVEGVRALLDEHDVAAVILEPTGSTFGQVPLEASFLASLRTITRDAGVVLIFDEVVSGFRVSPGGVQAHCGVVPDLTTLAKILAGGLPGGAVAGRRDILDAIDHQRTAASGRERIQHPGTFNANPVSAAAGIATLEIIRDTDACRRANDYAARLRSELNNVLVDEGVQWAVYGTFSGFHIFTNAPKLDVDPLSFDASKLDYATLKGTKGAAVPTKLRLAMRVNGVDLSGWPGGPVSAVHDEDDFERTVDAFRGSLRMLKAEGEIRI